MTDIHAGCTAARRDGGPDVHVTLVSGSQAEAHWIDPNTGAHRSERIALTDLELKITHEDMQVHVAETSRAAQQADADWINLVEGAHLENANDTNARAQEQIQAVLAAEEKRVADEHEKLIKAGLAAGVMVTGG